MTRLAEARLALLSHNLDSVVAAIDLVNTEYCATGAGSGESPLEQLRTNIAVMGVACRNDEKATKAAEDAVKIIEKLQQSGAHSDHQGITPDRGDLRKWGHVATDLRNDLIALTAEFEGDSLHDPLDNATRWERLDEIAQQCTTVMDSYVDVLRSVAIRSAGFDDRLCEIADELIRLTDYRWQSITVPAKNERMSLTGAGLVLLGLPGWTFWTLPLCLHDFAHTHFDNDFRNREGLTQLRDNADETDWAYIIAADAFAAASAGPAYACALALARLDPAQVARDPNGLDGRRAAVVLATLRQTAEVFDAQLGMKVPMDSALTFIDEIEGLWAESVRARGLPDDAAFMASADLIQPTLDAVITRDVIPFDYAQWEDTVVPLSAQLNTADAADIGRTADSDLRIVLNAGWVARINNASVDPKPVERTATKVCLNWLSRATPSDRSGPGFSQGGLR